MNNNKIKNKKKLNPILALIRLVLFLAVAILFTVGGGLLGILTGVIQTTEPLDPEKIVPEGYATIIYDDNSQEIAKLSGAEANRIEIDIDDIPVHLENAFVAIEDERFYLHNGIDIQAILRAVVVNLKTLDFNEGGSTLTQQVIKNNVLTPAKTILRKVQEQYLALTLEKQLSDKYGKKEAKKIILENYLNTINMGSGTYGVQAASQLYFGKDASNLTIAEAAVLSAITPNPTRFNPITNPDNNKTRQVMILGKLYEQGYISKSEYDEALEEDVYTNIQTISLRNESTPSFNSYFIDAVIEEVLDDLVSIGFSETDASNMLYRGGLSIYTTQDTEIQNILEDTFTNEELYPEEDFAIQLDYRLSVQHEDGTQEHFFNPIYPKDPWGTSLFKTKDEAYSYVEQFKKEKVGSKDKVIAENTLLIPQPQASMVIMDYSTGEVKALVGGRGEKIANRTLNRATDKNAARQPGSTFKVLAAYAPALDTGKYTPGTVIDDVPYTVGNYTPKNWYKGYEGLSTVRRGIIRSMNILAVKTVVDIGIDTAYDYLLNFGFTTLSDEDKYPPIALGGLYNGVTTLELNAAYSSIANKGVYIEPTLYTKIVDRKGNIIIEKNPETRTVLRETTAFLLTNMMEDVITEGTGWRAKFNEIRMPIAGKTGTTTNSKDLIFSAYTPYYSGTIWTGYDLPQVLTNQSYHLSLWKSAMEKIHQVQNLEYVEFDRPSGITTREICIDSGKLATELCEKDPRGSRVRTEYFVIGTEPTELCDVHYELEICIETGLLAGEYCPENTTETKVFIKRPEGMELDYEAFDQNTLESIEDYHLMLPPSMVGEYCNVHGPESLEDLDLPVFDEIDIPSLQLDNNTDKKDDF